MMKGGIQMTFVDKLMETEITGIQPPLPAAWLSWES